MSYTATLPAGWADVQLGDLVLNPKADLVDGPFGSNLRSNEYVEAGIPVLKIQNIKANRFVRKQLSYVTPDKAAELSRHSFVAGDLIITKLGEPLGLCCEVPVDLKHGIIVADLMRLRPSPKIVHSPFLLHAINSVVIQNQFKEITKGTTRQRVNLSIVRSIKISLPPLAEQRRIVAKIEELFSELDKGIENLKQARAQLAVYRQALLKHAFEGHLTADWRASNKDKLESSDQLLARIRDERRRTWRGAGKYSEPAEPETDDLPEIPSEWRWARIDMVGTVGSGMSVSKDRKLESPTEVPYLRVANVQRGRLDLSEIKIMKVEKGALDDLKLQAGDILFNEGGDRDKLGRGWVWEGQIDPCITQNHVFRVTPIDPTLIAPKFISHWGNTFGQQFFLSHGKQTTNLASINKAVLSRLPVPIPSSAEQLEIVAQIETQSSAVDALESDIDANLQKSEALRQAILKKAFAGELVPQDPADEPASGLLARIRIERAAQAPATKSARSRQSRSLSAPTR